MAESLLVGAAASWDAGEWIGEPPYDKYAKDELQGLIMHVFHTCSSTGRPTVWLVILLREDSETVTVALGSGVKITPRTSTFDPYRSEPRGHS